MQTGKSKILKLYPSLNSAHLECVNQALCPFEVKLPSKLIKEIDLICTEFLEHKKEVASAPWQNSVLNSLDFHYSSEKLKIIEANTNASGFLLSNLLLKDNVEETAIEFEGKILSSFQSIFENKNPGKIFIIDANPESEKMFSEFLMYKDFFNRNNIDAEIITTSKVITSNDSTYIYNRDTDFYLEKNLALKTLWTAKKVMLSTSPFAYQNIADKKFDHKNSILLNSLSNENRFEHLKSASLKTLVLSTKNKDELWGKRKHLFFKPPSSFGSKGVYSGKSISRKKFDTFKEGYLAQELHPPGKISHNDTPWKFDIRAFFSEKGVQKTVARVYQGQLTNFSNLGGGFALVKWVD